MISNIHKNIMGTVSFDGKFSGMRKARDFIVYPVRADDGHPMNNIKIQSDKQSGLIYLATGKVVILEGGYFNGPVKSIDQLTAEELLLLKSAIFASASGKAGNNGIVYCDNSGAIEALGQP